MDLQEDPQGPPDRPDDDGGTGQGTAAPDDAALEHALAGVQGVADAAVRRDPGSGRARLRLRLQSSEDRERVAWAVAAVLRERFGIALDPAAITPVMSTPRPQVPVPPAPPPPAAAAPGRMAIPPPPTGVVAPGSAPRAGNAPRQRVTITRLDLRRDERAVSATVGLAGPAGRVEGVVRSVPTAQGTLRAVAEATAQALGRLTSTPVTVGIDEVAPDPRAAPRRVTVAVTLLAGRGEEALLGVAVVRDDLERAVVRATLDALNRRVAPLLSPPEAVASQR